MEVFQVVGSTITETTLGAIAAALVLIYTAVIAPILFFMNQQIKDLRTVIATQDAKIMAQDVKISECEDHREEDMIWRARWEPTIDKLSKVAMLTVILARRVGDQLEIVEASGSVIEMFGWSPKELVGQNVDVLIHHRYQNAHHVASNANVAEALWRRELNDGLAVDKNGREFSVRVELEMITRGSELLYRAAIHKE